MRPQNARILNYTSNLSKRFSLSIMMKANEERRTTKRQSHSELRYIRTYLPTVAVVHNQSDNNVTIGIKLLVRRKHITSSILSVVQ